MSDCVDTVRLKGFKDATGRSDLVYGWLLGICLLRLILFLTTSLCPKNELTNTIDFRRKGFDMEPKFGGVTVYRQLFGKYSLRLHSDLLLLNIHLLSSYRFISFPVALEINEKGEWLSWKQKIQQLPVDFERGFGRPAFEAEMEWVLNTVANEDWIEQSKNL
ncbi:unnamed protein product [Thelazia callipaeda]|uniref:Transmembrane protein n=1 Tax=Thelazia callipaeda TaxID=103827 RepID=A0A0N5CTN6_THECL|nr:unnamed protein product [Thelazia callipaeda]